MNSQRYTSAVTRSPTTTSSKHKMRSNVRPYTQPSNTKGLRWSNHFVSELHVYRIEYLPTDLPITVTRRRVRAQNHLQALV